MNSDFQKQLTSKNTIEVARLITHEFITLYGEEWGSYDEIMSRLLPKGRACSWNTLDRNINIFCKQFYNSWEKDSDKIEFFDELRFFLVSLPQRKDYKIDETKEQFLNPEYISRYFTTCSLCWRSVLQKPLEKKTPLCHLHDLPSTHSEYRKLARLKKYVATTNLHLLKTQPPLITKKLGTEPNDYILELCLNKEGSLPHLANYLHALSLPLETEQELIRALEYPIHLDKVSTLVQKTWVFYINDRAKHLKFIYLQIINAEAWLQVINERKHGGKRF